MPSSSSTSSGPPTNKINKLFHRNGSGGSKQSSTPPSSYEPPSSDSNHSSPSSGGGIRPLVKKLSKARLSTSRDRSPPEKSASEGSDVISLVDTPVIVEPPDLQVQQPPPPSSSHLPQRRHSAAGRRSFTVERPLSMAGYDPAQPSPSSNKFADLPNRLSGWFSNAFPVTSLPAPDSADTPPSSQSTAVQSSTSSATVVPASPPKQRAVFLGVGKHPGRGLGGGIERAVRYILDSDSHPDRCLDPIWLMGVKHPGYEPPSPQATIPEGGHKRESTEATHQHHSRRSTPPTVSRSSGVAYHSNNSLQSLNTTLQNPGKGKEVLSWPPAFYEDYTSCIWMTYRNQYVGIRDSTLAALEQHATYEADPTKHGQGTEVISSPPRKWWGGDRTWTSDTGWGCMLRTGQSLLATALIRHHLSREWRRPSVPTPTTEYATYVKILTWFLDSPSKLSPFSVHRMALAGKDLGTDVGSWFGPSIAAGAIKTLVHAFPESGMAVSLASDGVVFESDVRTASHLHGPAPASKSDKWGSKAVLILIGIRLGIDGVNPIYYDSVKDIFTWPQSVGISGGRPSSSYYFVGEQAGSLFYLDPHYTRPAVPLRQPPPADAPLTTPSSPATTTTSQLESTESADDSATSSSQPPHNTTNRRASSNLSPDRDDRSSLGLGLGAKLSRMASAGGSIKQKHRQSRGATPSSPNASRSLSIPQHHHTSPPQTSGSGFTYVNVMNNAHGSSPSGSSFSSVVPAPPSAPGVDPLTHHYFTAYSQTELRTFHCEKVRKMSLPSLDPSMLLGFLVRDEEEWRDLRKRHANLPKAIFTIQDEPLSWQTKSVDADLESLSDEPIEEDDHSNPDLDNIEMEEEPPASSARTAFFDAEEGEDDDDDDHKSIRSSRRVSDTPSVHTHETESDLGGDGRRSSTLTSSSNKDSSREATPTDDSIDSLGEEDDDDDWDSSIPSSSSPPAVIHTSAGGGLEGKSHNKSKSLGTPIPVREASPPPSRVSMSAALPPIKQYPFPSGRSDSSPPSPEPLQSGPFRQLSSKLPKRRTSLKGKDGGRTPSGGVLAIFNPAGKDHP